MLLSAARSASTMLSISTSSLIQLANKIQPLIETLIARNHCPCAARAREAVLAGLMFRFVELCFT